MKHQVTMEELDAWLNRESWQLFASSSDRYSDKLMTLEERSGTFCVKDHGSIRYFGIDKAKALQAYNDAP